jgi:ferredoxin-NADP reductase
MAETLDARVRTIRLQADDIVSVELVPLPGGHLPPFAAGSHVDVHLPSGMVRSYSLLNSQDERDRYELGILKDRASRGGSRWVHEQLRVGQVLKIGAPRNNFVLHEDAAHSVLVAGGIGVTPILAMARRLQSLGRPFEVIFLARTRAQAAFADEMEALCGNVHWHFDIEQGGPPDMRALLAQRPAGVDTHYYACGPAPMLDAFEKACKELGYANAHIERFVAVEVEAASDARTTFQVELRRTGKSIQVTPATTLLQAIRACGVEPTTSCEEGICGSCETKVLEGVPDHRDSVLTDKERESNKTMMVCVGGCRSERLVLDI